MIWRFKRTTQADPQTIAPVAEPVTNQSVDVSGGSSPQVEAQSDQSAVYKTGAEVAKDKTNVELAGLDRAPLGAYIVPTNYKIVGEVVTERAVVIRGELAGGRLVAPEVNIVAGGALRSPTQARVVKVKGAAWKPIVASDYIEVSSGGCIGDDIEAPQLIMHPGGAISGARLAIGPRR